MSAKIEVGTGWHGHYYSKPYMKAVFERVNSYEESKHKFTKERPVSFNHPWPSINGEGGEVNLPTGETKVSFYTRNKKSSYFSPWKKTKVTYENAQNSSFTVNARPSHTEVVFNSEDIAISEIDTEGEVLIEESQSPKTVSYKLIGLGSSLRIKQKDTDELKITHQEQELTIFSGSVGAYHISQDVKLGCALKVSEELTNHPNTMLQFTPDEILESIKKGWAVLALDGNMKLAGSARLWQYGFNEDGQQILEFGSWLSFIKGQGLGEKILKETVGLGKIIDPKAQIVAIVEKENKRAQEILDKVGGKIIGTKLQPAIRTVEGEDASMIIYDITNV